VAPSREEGEESSQARLIRRTLGEAPNPSRTHSDQKSKREAERDQAITCAKLSTPACEPHQFLDDQTQRRLFHLPKSKQKSAALRELRLPSAFSVFKSARTNVRVKSSRISMQLTNMSATANKPRCPAS